MPLEVDIGIFTDPKAWHRSRLRWSAFVKASGIESGREHTNIRLLYISNATEPQQQLQVEAAAQINKVIKEYLFLSQLRHYRCQIQIW